MEALPIPPDFKSRAPLMSVSDLKRHYGRGYHTIMRWCRLSGVKPKPPEKPPPKPTWKFNQPDTPEQIEMCLHCTLRACAGWCAKIAWSKQKKENGKRKHEDEKANR